MELFDSHAHYDDEEFDKDRDAVIKDIYNSGVTKFMSAGYNVKSSKIGIELSHKYNCIYTTIGISPNDVSDTIEEVKEKINEIKKMLDDEIEYCKNNNIKTKIVGIGEIGLDYHYNTENKELQKFTFIEQIKLANKYNLPIVIHTREAIMDTIDILKNIQPSNNFGVIHCCPLNRELVKELLKLGFYISFCGPVTFKSSKNASEIINMVPDDKMLIETDSPCLAPEPVRGTRNDSRNVRYIAQKVAIEKNEPIEDIAKKTYENAEKIFKISTK